MLEPNFCSFVNIFGKNPSNWVWEKPMSIDYKLVLYIYIGSCLNTGKPMDSEG